MCHCFITHLSLPPKYVIQEIRVNTSQVVKFAIKFATITRVVNATKLQKKLKIGCSRAEKYVETMQNLGIIGRDEFYILRTES